MKIPGFEGGLATVLGTIIAAIMAVTALFFGASVLVQSRVENPTSSHVSTSSHSESMNDRTPPPTGDNGTNPSDSPPPRTIPADAVRADPATTKRLLEAGLKGVTFSGQTLRLRPNTRPIETHEYPFRIGGSDGCNTLNASARFRQDGTLQFKEDSHTKTKAFCEDVPGQTEFRRILDSGTEIYTRGEQILVVNGALVLEFVRQ